MTLLGQTIAMAVFVWFCMKFIWPPILHALEERQKQMGFPPYDKEQAELAWTRVIGFFDRCLRK